MAYDENLAGKVRKIMQEEPGFDEKKMFGGICFLLNGNMACGILDNELIVRVGKDDYENTLNLPHVRKFDITGRPMKGWVMISAQGFDNMKALREWTGKGIVFARTLPPKKK